MLELIQKSQQPRPSVIALLATNFVALAGVLFFSWNVTSLMLAYWAESAVIGFYSMLKILFSKAHWVLKIFLTPFFAVHFSGFMFGHLLFILFFFQVLRSPDAVQQNPFPLSPGDFLQIIAFLAASLASHGISFYTNYIQGREYERAEAAQVAFASPYSRIITMHVTILAGGFLGMALVVFSGGQTRFFAVGAGVALVLIKTYFDLKAHLKERENYAQASRVE